MEENAFFFQPNSSRELSQKKWKAVADSLEPIFERLRLLQIFSWPRTVVWFTLNFSAIVDRICCDSCLQLFRVNFLWTSSLFWLKYSLRKREKTTSCNFFHLMHHLPSGFWTDFAEVLVLKLFLNAQNETFLICLFWVENRSKCWILTFRSFDLSMLLQKSDTRNKITGNASGS